jgi:hypothetical protein
MSLVVPLEVPFSTTLTNGMVVPVDCSTVFPVSVSCANTNPGRKTKNIRKLSAFCLIFLYQLFSLYLTK